MSSKVKLLAPCNAERLVREWKQQGKKVVFTNGCFDILHAGHVQYLEKAKATGDVLIVGVNSDGSVKRLKGQNRPIASETDRCTVLAGLEAVDATVIFDEDTPARIIERLLPDILIKGADWPIDKIVGAKTVLEHGGEVKTIEFLEGRSTTSIIERIIEIYCREK
ncbi:D-glycero-beta-D-manno-heptose 1-phosphate adenylyltransferase [Prosthecochloris sp. SCSIO W1102]|uniref:D-glycero-beta-D-manno-heptose 1-phosphate adenylyltransferase n=1 Tax=Prosthecochloris sp. SCSIO W1102 TaxID=2992243 RepID=UPI00223D3687|nr:D-glycero-beta-D-manno-heptose 1-phosphate adenylyltransferase [Prosthecochloris sp. SCSIO W1102]UZJ39128.1 D-glycero-beta-D-manno-heptose 1-phosphate adenylyltransferase [Prosthecochloris sp. SCSIO W1102]